jgi:hypothetical protein
VTKQTVKENQILVAIAKCLARTPEMRVKILENAYEMVRESRLMYGAEIWGRCGKNLCNSREIL